MKDEFDMESAHSMEDHLLMLEEENQNEKDTKRNMFIQDIKEYVSKRWKIWAFTVLGLLLVCIFAGIIQVLETKQINENLLYTTQIMKEVIGMTYENEYGQKVFLDGNGFARIIQNGEIRDEVYMQFVSIDEGMEWFSENGWTPITFIPV
jgi:hypothetical protein